MNPLSLTLTALAAAVLGLGAAPVARLFTRAAGRAPGAPEALAGAAASAWAGLAAPTPLLAAAGCLLGFGLVALAAVDIAAWRLPDRLTGPLAATGLLVTALAQPEALPGHLIGGLIGYAALAVVAWGFVRWRGREALGMGDAKLCAVGGAWLGWSALPSMILLACLGGLLVFAGAALLRGRGALGRPIAFGVPLAVAIWLVWVFGGPQAAAFGGLIPPTG